MIAMTGCSPKPNCEELKLLRSRLRSRTWWPLLRDVPAANGLRDRLPRESDLIQAARARFRATTSLNVAGPVGSESHALEPAPSETEPSWSEDPDVTVKGAELRAP
jgi:hypothetical protein